jgi:hypothetical protein
MRKISRQDIEFGEWVVTVEMPYSEFVQRFGAKHADHPADWDAPGPVELWFFELPWGQKITLEYHLTLGQFNIYMGRLEIESILEYLDLKNYTYSLRTETVELLKKCHPRYTDGLGIFNLYRQDDNGNRVVMRSYESFRVADYYKRKYESLGHKQTYWVEKQNT